MIKSLKITFLLGLLTGCQSSVSSEKEATIETQLQAVLAQIYQEHPEATGIMAHIEAPKQQLSWSGAVGYAERKNKQAVEADQPALIASNTKTYVAVAILRLVEQGKLSLEQPIDSLLTDKTRKVLIDDGYALDLIQVKHLLTHTGGLFNYVDAPDFFAQLQSNPRHRWTRDEQITLATSSGDPLGQPGDTFKYADTNYLLLSEIIEQLQAQPFYQAIRQLLNYDKHDFNSTWFVSLEEVPENTKPLVHQYFGEIQFDTYEMDPSFDLYGGGGLAATTRDLARFSQALFNQQLFEQSSTLPLIYTTVKTKDPSPSDYFLGLSKSKIGAFETFGHGGFWGTIVHYIPKLDASIAVFILERDQRKLRKKVAEQLVERLK